MPNLPMGENNLSINNKKKKGDKQMTRRKVKAISIIALVVGLPIIAIILSIVSLVNNSKTKEQLLILETEINQLEYRVARLEELNEMEEVEEVEGTEKKLEELIASDDPEDLIKAATYGGATEAQLIEIARKGATINYYSTNSPNKRAQVLIEEALMKDPATTKAVMEEFKASQFDSIKEAAQYWIDNH